MAVEKDVYTFQDKTHITILNNLGENVIFQAFNQDGDPISFDNATVSNDWIAIDFGVNRTGKVVIIG